MSREDFFSRRWRGDVPVRVIFWRDMLGVGTFVNLMASFMALMLASQGVDDGIAVAVHFLPLPYNLFLFLAVWRAPRHTVFKRVIAALWLAAMTLV